jgi:RNA polymerase sigma-70 factor (ECF subfamily)
VFGLEINLDLYDNEEQLLEALRSGEPDACTCLVKRFAPLIYKHALRMLNDPDEAEGILQQTFIKACEKITTFEGRSGLGTWLYRIATNEALMKLRQQKSNRVQIDKVVETMHSEDVPQNMQNWSRAPSDAALDTELREQLETALTHLPEGLRLVFVLREMQGMNTEETARTLGLSESAVKVRLHRARLRLRELLADYMTIDECDTS